jgi:Protein of unknown function (DUF2934)
MQARVKEQSMFEKEPAKSAAAKPKGKAAATPRAKTTATKSGSGTAAGAKRREDNTYERIQRRAYELWENEGRPAGREHAHWLQAEREIARARAHRVGVSQ